MAEKKEANRKDFDRMLDTFEVRLAELRVTYEQYFIDVVQLPPDKQHKEIKLMIKELLRAPFKDSAKKFRMRTLITRYQTYATYWERVNKQREEGRYVKDVFKAEKREKAVEDMKRQASDAGLAENGIKQLYSSYENALKKAGVKSSDLDYGAFKKNLINKARQMKEKHGAKKLTYKVVVKNGKAVIKASAKK